MSIDNDKDEHWNDIINIVNRNNKPLSERKIIDSEGSDMSHDDAIFDFIASEVDRTHVAASAEVAGTESPTVISPWYKRVSTIIFGSIKERLPIPFTGVGAAGFALAVLSAVVILPIAYLVSTNTEGGSAAIVSQSHRFEMPTAVVAVAENSQKYIDYSGSAVGIASSVQTERYKAFMTGVVHSDINILDRDMDSNNEDLKQSLLQYHSINIIQEATDSASAKEAFEEALASYQNSDKYGKWLYKGMVIELIYLTANVGLDTKDYASLASMLTEYGKSISIDQYDGQSDKYYKEHDLLLSFVDKAQNNGLSDYDVREVRKHARNIKVRIQ